MKCPEYEDLVAAHADGLLSGDELDEAERHAQLCPPCEAMRRGQTAVKRLLAGRAPQRAPESLRAAILDQTSAAQPTPRRRPATMRLVISGAIAALLLLAVAPLLLRNGDADLVQTMAADVDRAAAESPQLATASLSELRSYYAHNGLTFDESVEDLEPYGIHLIGGSISHIGKVATTLTIYDSDGKPVVCRRFRSGQLALPNGGRRFGRSEVFDHEGVHVALTRLDGDVICAMASRTPIEELFASAHAQRISSTR